MPCDDDETFDMENSKAPRSQSNYLAVQLKYMSLQIGELGEEYLTAAMRVQYASCEMRSALRKAHDKKIEKKQSTARQSLVSAFIKK